MVPVQDVERYVNRMSRRRAEADGPLLVGGFGNPWAGDLDFGPWFARSYRDHGWQDGVIIEEICLAAHRVLHLFRELRPAAVVLVAGFPRGGPPGAVRHYRPDRTGLDDAEVQQRLGESASGVIDLDHLLAIATFYGDLPDDTLVIEVEPAATAFSDELSPVVASRGAEVLALVEEELRRHLPAGRRDHR